MQRLISNNILVGFVLGLLIISGAIAVKAVAPGVISNPTFNPSSDDVTGGLGIPCNWPGTQLKMVWDDGGSDEGCMGLNVRCENGNVTELHTGVMFLEENGSVNGPAQCGSIW